MSTTPAPGLPADNMGMPHATPSTPAFTPPRPGFWERDIAHWPRRISAWTAEVAVAPFRDGFRDGASRFGLLISHIEIGVVERYVYNYIVPAVDPSAPDAEEAMGRRFATCIAALESRAWREDLALWDEQVKPDSLRRHRALQAVDLARLDDAALADHLEACRENMEIGIYRHHRFTVPAIIATGLFLARAMEWTGASRSDLLALLQGSSPVSNGIAAAELREVGAALEAEGLDPQAFAGLPAALVLDRLENDPGAVGAAVRRYLDACGQHVTTGYDVLDLTTRELPDTVLTAFWNARGGATRQDDDAALVAARTRALRERVPAEHRATFDDLLAEARTINRLRDERGVYNDLWAIGIARLALLEAGRRLAVRGRIDDEALVFEATPGEILALLRGGDAPDSAELAARARRAVPAAALPETLGDPPPPPPPIEQLPPEIQPVTIAIALAIEEVLGGPSGDDVPSQIAGKGVSAGVYEGTARLVTGPSDFNRLMDGDVLVTPSTNAAFNVVLPLLGAIVTDRGALLSHAAIVAREYGLPAVVATGIATQAIPDGARVRVDGTRGTVEVLS